MCVNTANCQMAARLTMSNEEEAIYKTWERQLFSELALLKSCKFSEDLAGKFNLSHTCRRTAFEW